MESIREIEVNDFSIETVEPILKAIRPKWKLEIINLLQTMSCSPLSAAKAEFKQPILFSDTYRQFVMMKITFNTDILAMHENGITKIVTIGATCG